MHGFQRNSLRYIGYIIVYFPYNLLNCLTMLDTEQSDEQDA